MKNDKKHGGFFYFAQDNDKENQFPTQVISILHHQTKSAEISKTAWNIRLRRRRNGNAGGDSGDGNVSIWWSWWYETNNDDDDYVDDDDQW